MSIRKQLEIANSMSRRNDFKSSNCKKEWQTTETLTTLESKPTSYNCGDSERKPDNL